MHAESTSHPTHLRGLASGLLVIVILAVTLLLMRQVIRLPQAAALPSGASLITQSVLEEQYGLRVRLIGVTAAGGMIDLRLSILDAAKAKTLLSDANHLPLLWVPGRRLSLKATEDSSSQALSLADGGALFLLYPNTGNAVKPGDPVMLSLGKLVVEAVPAQ